MDFKKYKTRLIEYLSSRGTKIGSDGLCLCINPDHKERTPSCKVSDDKFHCFACGIHGDIYDAVNVLENISAKKDQFIFLQERFGDTPPQKPIASNNSSEKFIPCQRSIDLVVSFLKSNKASQKAFKEFLNQRARIQTKGVQRCYPAHIETFLMKNMLYWNGLDIILNHIDRSILKKAGIPLVNPQTGVSSWASSG
ncbi:MAG: CHC2 zinc finger domain-containing protein, partial [Treponemataceae bacterium]